jgi:hypothetical protein
MIKVNGWASRLITVHTIRVIPRGDYLIGFDLFLHFFTNSMIVNDADRYACGRDSLGVLYLKSYAAWFLNNFSPWQGFCKSVLNWHRL